MLRVEEELTFLDKLSLDELQRLIVFVRKRLDNPNMKGECGPLLTGIPDIGNDFEGI
jgi:hypothetical protein